MPCVGNLCLIEQAHERFVLMIHQIVTRVSFDSFHQRAAGKKVILLYPWTNYRNLFLTHFLSNAKDGLIYYRIPSDETKLVDWLEGLINELDSVLGGFGKQTKAQLAQGSAAQLGEALAADLAKYNNSDPLVL